MREAHMAEIANRWRKKLVGNVIVFVGIIGVALLVKSKYERFTIPQNGMYPNYPANSSLWVTKPGYESIEEVRLGDVIVFRRELNGLNYNYIWRVVGLPGDHVLIETDQVTRNGVLLHHEPERSERGVTIYVEHNGDASYEIAYDSSADEDARRGLDIVVPEGEILVLGDNRFAARDSRYDGTVAFESIIGKD
jgi:signal peptidase I